MQVSSTTVSSPTIRIKTDETAWSVSAVNADGSPCEWITDLTPASGEATDGLDVSFYVLDDTPPYESAYLLVSAGDLTYKVLVTVEQWNTFAYSNIVATADGRLTFATTARENKTSPANVLGLLFKWGSLIGLNAIGTEGSAFTSSRVTFIPSEYPTKTFTEYSAIPRSQVADGETMGNSYDATQGTGDICRYISDKGWVKGKWRMPTSREAMSFENSGNEMSIGDIIDDHSFTYTFEDYISPYGTDVTTTGRFCGNPSAAATAAANPEPYFGGSMPKDIFFFPMNVRMIETDGALSTFGWGMFWMNGTFFQSLDSSSWVELFIIVPRAAQRNSIGNRGNYPSPREGALPVRCVRDL
jgi:hypothetical protein